MTTERFHIGDLLSITTEKLVSPTGMDGPWRLIDFVTGQQHFTHQIPRAAEAIQPELIKQFPWLSEITAPDFTGERAEREAEVRLWLAVMAEEYDEWHVVTQMPLGAYVGREPIAELQEMAPHMPILAVEVPKVDGDDPAG